MSYISLSRRTGSQYSENSVCLSDEDCRLILPYLKRIEKDLLIKYEKYRDIRDSGEATERQTDLLCDYNRKLDAIQSIISDSEELLKPKVFTEEQEIEWDLKNARNKLCK